MKLICTHDPADPEHLICEAKYSPLGEWFRTRYRQFYCVGPTCPPHKAYTHLWVDLVLAILAVSLLVSNVIFAVKGRRTDEATRDMLQEQIDKVAGEAPTPQEPAPPQKESSPFAPVLLLEGRALYFSSEGEQLGRGPWPPHAGEITRVKVFLDVEGITAASDNLQKRFREVSVQGHLAESVEWTGFAPLARRLSYVPASQTVVWYPEDNSSVAFEVAVRPTANEVAQGSILVLRNLTLRGRAIATGLAQEIKIPDIVLIFK